MVQNLLKIGITGCPGSGKSTLANALAKAYNLPLIQEPIESCPSHIKHNRLAMSLWMELYGSKLLNKQEMFVSDYVPQASLAIFDSQQEGLIIESFADAFDINWPVYDIIIGLDCTDTTLLSRIAKRARNDMLAIEMANTYERNANFKAWLKTADCIIIDANKPIGEVFCDVTRCINSFT